MTTPHQHPLPPLRDLPPPPRRAPEDPALVPPAEIILDSRSELTRRLLRRFWAPGLVLAGLWLILLWLYVSGASPTLWALALLGGLVEPALLRSAMISLGFTSTGLWLAVLLVPLLGVLASAATIPLIARAVAALQPRTFLTEAAFQRAVATRITAVLMAPVLAAIATTVLTATVGLGPHWTRLGAGPLCSLAAAVIAVQLAWLWVRALVSAPRILGVTTVSVLESTAGFSRDLDARRAAGEQLRAQDRRHLPPNPGTPQAVAALRPMGYLRASAVIGRACLVWVLPTLAVLAWMVFGIVDMVAAFSGITELELMQVRGPATSWRTLIGALLPATGVALAIGLVPAGAILLSQNQLGEVTDQRTHRDWVHRARVNPWEARVALLSGVLAGLLAAAMPIGSMLLWMVLGARSGVTVTWVVLGLLVIAPLIGLATWAAMKEHLRFVLYGAAGRYMRRAAPHALVAPEVGTKADRARDPVVRAAIRERLRAEGGPGALEIFDLDHADGERLWVDDSQPGATPTQIRRADIARGVLPDFGGEGSPFTAPGSADPAGHDIPETLERQLPSFRRD